MGMTKERRQARQLILNWCDSEAIEVKGIRHIHPVCYVVGLAAPRCLIVSRPWVHSEEHLQQFDRENPLTTVHTFDDRLKAGDWCVTGYVTTRVSGEVVAVAFDAVR